MYLQLPCVCYNLSIDYLWEMKMSIWNVLHMYLFITFIYRLIAEALWAVYKSFKQ